MDTLKVTNEIVNPDLETVRAGLAGQKRREWRRRADEILERATAEFGLAFTTEEITARVAAVLPWVPFKKRSALWIALEDYAGTLPDAAILAWQRAEQSRLFTSFDVVEPRYVSRAPAPDPWLVGHVSGYRGQAKDWIVLAYWD